jgi:hypothetical protein
MRIEGVTQFLDTAVSAFCCSSVTAIVRHDGAHATIVHLSTVKVLEPKKVPVVVIVPERTGTSDVRL